MAVAPVITLEVEELALQRGGRAVITDLSFSASRGELLAITGESGTGKTSVLRAIGGLDPIASGEIRVSGIVLRPGVLPHARQLRDLHRSVGMVFQFHHLFSHMTALRNVWLAPVHVLGEPRETAERRACDLLDALGVGDRADAMPHELSGGEAQRVAIARALAVDPPVLLMDEPTASLDPVRRLEIAGTLRKLAAQGRTVLVATPDDEVVRACADRVVVLDPHGSAPDRPGAAAGRARCSD